MEIRVSLDETLLRQYASRGSSLFFEIAMFHEGQAYPHENWADFGVRILSWWTTEMLRFLKQGRGATFAFMDGDWEVAARPLGTTGLLQLRLARRELTWEVPVVDLAEAILLADRATLDAIQEMSLETTGTSKQDLEVLATTMSNLRKFMEAGLDHTQGTTSNH